jgi:hypothetical protein
VFVGLPTVRDGHLDDNWTPGKITFDYFFPPFARTLAEHSIDARAFPQREFRAEPRRGDLAVLVYTERHAHECMELAQLVEATQSFAERSGFRVAHSIETGRLVIDKTRTNRALAAAGIPVPKLIVGDTAPSPVFSNVNSSCQQAVYLRESGASLDPERHNTEFIDTTFHHDGKDYYVVLRAMCVGSACYSIMPRARPVGDGDPSVHGKNTPLDAALLNSICAQIIAPRKAAILEICERLGQLLGLGFYSHDILPKAALPCVFVCETGFKFDNRATRQHLGPLRGQLTNDDYLTDEAPIRAARALARELGRL